MHRRKLRFTASAIADLVQDEDSDLANTDEEGIELQQNTTPVGLPSTSQANQDDSKNRNPADVIPGVTSRKIYPQPHTWKRNVLKKARLSGTPVSDGDTVIPGKAVNLGTLCSDSCLHQCNNKLTESNRHRIHQEYYDCVSIDEKNQFIRIGIERSIPQRPRSEVKTHARDHSYHYFLMVSRHVLMFMYSRLTGIVRRFKGGYFCINLSIYYEIG